ncbi:MAG: MFS transporter, partial [Proteobacteria bacterium]|nr:MFS transporter [Pseudomonadota bacterium]
MPILFLIVVVDLIGFGIIIPLLPFYAEHFHASPAMVGLLMASYSAAQFVAAPYWGQLSDRIGRRPVLLFSLAGAVAAYIGLAFADNLAMLFLMRALGGFMAGNISTAFAYVADVTTRENRAKGMGVVGAAFGIGFILGPAIGGILAGDDPMAADYRTPSLAAAALSLTALVLTALFLKESLSAAARADTVKQGRTGRWRALKQAIMLPGVGFLILLSFLATFVFAGLESTFAMWSRRQFGWGPAQNGYLFAFIGLLSAAVQGGAVGVLARRFGEDRLISAGALLLALGIGGIPLSQTVPVLVFTMALAGLGFSLISPALNSAISVRAGDNVQGSLMGVTRSATTFS